MKTYLLTIILLWGSLSVGKANEPMQKVIARGMERAGQQALLMAKSLEQQKDRLPRSIDKNGNLVTSDSHWWCSGFFPGVLWYLYEDSRNEQIKQYAEDYTARVADQQYTVDNHDVGFILNCSFGNGYRLTGRQAYLDVLMQGAKSLSQRYRAEVGLIRSWDHNTAQWQYPVIIDNMMNLELIELAARKSGDPYFERIAYNHALKTMVNHFRSDYSSYHVVSYHPQTGIAEKKNTHQGLSHESAWARGQAWGLYGFTMMYRETKDTLFLNQAKHIARFLLNHPNMPQDGIPYWDFDAPDIPSAPRDASAGAIMASAFVELATLLQNDLTLASDCRDMAERQIRTLTSDDYLAAKNTNGNFILRHSVGNLPSGNEVDVPLTYADYYYIEALSRYKKWILNHN